MWRGRTMGVYRGALGFAVTPTSYDAQNVDNQGAEAGPTVTMSAARPGPGTGLDTPVSVPQSSVGSQPQGSIDPPSTDMSHTINMDASIFGNPHGLKRVPTNGPVSGPMPAARPPVMEPQGPVPLMNMDTDTLRQKRVHQDSSPMVSGFGSTEEQQPKRLNTTPRPTPENSPRGAAGSLPVSTTVHAYAQPTQPTQPVMEQCQPQGTVPGMPAAGPAEIFMQLQAMQDHIKKVEAENLNLRQEATQEILSQNQGFRNATEQYEQNTSDNLKWSEAQAQLREDFKLQRIEKENEAARRSTARILEQSHQSELQRETQQLRQQATTTINATQAAAEQAIAQESRKAAIAGSKCEL